MQRKHVEQLGLLMAQLKTSQLENDRLAKSQEERENLHVDTQEKLNARFDRALDAYQQRERQLAAELLKNQQELSHAIETARAFRRAAEAKALEKETKA